MANADSPLALRIKQMILTEELAPGERITEVGLSERLGVSRTPIRNLLPRLAAEGFLQPVGKRGYTIAGLGDEEMLDALDLRSSLEGWAAADLARRGASEATLAELRECLETGDALFSKGHLTPDDEAAYGRMNHQFHGAERLNQVPFLAPSVIAFDQVGLRNAFNFLLMAHQTHHSIVDAISERDSARAEALFREHGRQQRTSMFNRRGARVRRAAG
jgi:GntR family transcriptional regulator, vanillate catabolism transcriptional regulator